MADFVSLTCPACNGKLPDDDPELRAYNLDLLDRYGSEGRSVVFARLSVARAEATPQVFAPVLKAA